MSAPPDVHAWLAAHASRTIETSCAWVFLGPEDRALKLKKPVNYGFLDFTTPAKRRWALDRELAFNRITAPDIYRRVRIVTRAPDGSLSLGGDGETIDFVLEMRAFDPDAVLAEHPERVDGDMAEALGRIIARFHATAEARPEGGGAAGLGYTIRSNAEHLRALAPELGRAATERLVAASDAELATQSPLLEQRRREGFARRCHGDLHLGNIVCEAGQPTLFDCIEFNDRFSDIEVLYDVAFLIMDLAHRGRDEAANRVLIAWLDEAARTFPETLWDGLAALPLMLSARAAVRAHVIASEGDLPRAQGYLAAAETHLARPAPALLAIGGVSGTGKTTLARRVAPWFGAPPGAVVLRSDEVRKRLSGVEATRPLGGEAYLPAVDERVYGEMANIARRVIAAGRPVVLDATFLDPAHRRDAEAIARDAGVPFHGLWLAGEPDQLRMRLAHRRGDASDADARVLGQQLSRDVGRLSWERAEASDLESAAQRLLRPGRRG